MKVKSMAKTALKEVDVARPLVAWLREMDWQVYQEVGSIHADIVAILGRVSWIIEAKRFLNWKVIRQARAHICRATWVSVCVPYGSYCDEAGIVLRHYGIGCLETSLRNSVKERLKPRTNRNLACRLTKLLDDRQKTYCEAGSPGGSAWSPFRATCERLLEVVQQQPGITLSDAIKAIKHHYASSASAKQSLTIWIQQDKVAGIRCERHKSLCLFLK
jgi:hypothetical protein